MKLSFHFQDADTLRFWFYTGKRYATLRTWFRCRVFKHLRYPARPACLSEWQDRGGSLSEWQGSPSQNYESVIARRHAQRADPIIAFPAHLSYITSVISHHGAEMSMMQWASVSSSFMMLIVALRKECSRQGPKHAKNKNIQFGGLITGFFAVLRPSRDPLLIQGRNMLAFRFMIHNSAF